MSSMLLVDLPPRTTLLELPLIVTERLAEAVHERNGGQNTADLLKLLEQMVQVFENWPASFRSFFQSCARDLRPEQVPQFHELRSQLHERVAEARAQCRRWLDLCQAQRSVPGINVLTERFRTGLGGLDKLESEFFERWNTLEDLEDLLAAHFPLSNEQLKKLAEKHKPPQSWYDETDKPF